MIWPPLHPQLRGRPQKGSVQVFMIIPWEFRVGTGAAKQFTTVNHVETITASGNMTISKGGHSETKAANDPTTSF